MDKNYGYFSGDGRSIVLRHRTYPEIGITTYGTITI